MEADNRRPLGSEDGHQPLVSVITVVFQDRNELEAIVCNLQPFRGEKLEFIVVDGGSADGTVEFLSEHPEHVDAWMSEPDRGVYDAMNKGLRAARGTYILHINAGDRLLQIPWNTLEFCAKERVDVVSGRVLMDGNEVFVSRTTFTSRIDNTWHHQGTFYRSAAHLGYDDSYGICGDFDHNQRLLKAGRSIRHVSDVIAEHRNDGLSMQERARREIYRSIRKNYGYIYLLPAAVRFKLARLWLWWKQRRHRMMQFPLP